MRLGTFIGWERIDEIIKNRNTGIQFETESVLKG